MICVCVCVLRILRACYIPGNLISFHFTDLVVFDKYSNLWSLWLRRLYSGPKIEYFSYYIWHRISPQLRTHARTHTHTQNRSHTITNIILFHFLGRPSHVLISLRCGQSKFKFLYFCNLLKLTESWPDFLSGSGSGTGYTREVNWGATWIK